MVDLYIYYKVRDEHAQQLGPRVRAMQAALAAQAGVSGTVKRRPGALDGRQTWMEIYLATPDGFGNALAAALEHAGLDQFTDGPRHTEVFTDISTCA
ncbi:DUF4936 domain-containing protein [Massilia violaceinigra]|uniref:DUF4936 domain-containing protein n=1 Tax=Massilia violaceinigra TaxID=2045208 RepID=A0A2D2DQF0_9BURK|nr:DUF4936 family protein [Massilia violaceinigra]ATQ77204.1 DUF4936 domain-containing protein [Massilia violaceinigra]